MFRHGPTYAGHATCCAAALANLELLERDGLLEQGRENEQALFEALSGFAGHEAVAEVRGGIGTLAAVELAADVLERSPGAVGQAAVAARATGVLLRPLGRALAVSPPLTSGPEHFALITQAVEEGLGAVLSAAR